MISQPGLVAIQNGIGALLAMIIKMVIVAGIAVGAYVQRLLRPLCVCFVPYVFASSPVCMLSFVPVACAKISFGSLPEDGDTMPSPCRGFEAYARLLWQDHPIGTGATILLSPLYWEAPLYCENALASAGAIAVRLAIAGG